MSGEDRFQEPFPQGFEEHRRDQAGIGLTMTPAERLRWLQETMEKLQRWVGRASRVPDNPVVPQ